MDSDREDRVMRDGRFGIAGRGNAVLAWVFLVIFGALGGYLGVAGRYRWFFFSAAAVILVLLPPAATRDALAMPPWGLLALAAVPLLDASVFGPSPVSPVATYLAVAAIALIVVVDLHRYTSVRMTPPFVVALVLITTLATSAVWNVALWITDHLVGTTYLVGDRSADAANAAMMFDFLFAAIAGAVAGLLFLAYLHRIDGLPRDRRVPPDRDPVVRPSLSERTALPTDRLRELSFALQAGLGVLFAYGLLIQDVPTVVNAGLAFGVTLLPPVFERNVRVPLEPELIAWLTVAAFLHAIGSAGLYDLLGPWDNLTHAVSASLVAATGYATVRAIDLHSDRVYLPPQAMFGFLLVFILAVGVIWELAEFGVDLATQTLEVDAALAQHGIGDTVGDLFFDLLGGIVAATIGASYLTGFSLTIADRFEVS